MSAGIFIAAVSLIPGVIAQWEQYNLKQAKKCRKFPPDSKGAQPGQYWLRGPLHSTGGIKIDINTGGFIASKNMAVMRYEIDECVESKINTKRKVSKKVNHDNKERKEGEPMGAEAKEESDSDIRSHWERKFKNIYKSPIQYAADIDIDGINIDAFKELFSLQSQYETYASSPNLNGSDNKTEWHLNINIIGENRPLKTETDNLGEVDRKIVGYKHRWMGVQIGDTYTILGYWNGAHFERGEQLSMITKKDFDALIKEYELHIMLWRGLCVTGLLIGSMVGVYEKNMLNILRAKQ